MEQDITAIIEEPPGGANHGRRTNRIDAGADNRDINDSARPGASRFAQALDAEHHQREEFMRGGGFAVVTTRSGSTGRGGYEAYGYRDAGMTTHRGVLHPEEHIHQGELVALIEREMGYTIDQLHSVYSRGGGPLPGALRALRTAIDCRLLELSESGANMEALYEITGLAGRTARHAMERARAAREAA